MALKYLILAVLAIQAVNAGVIKTKSTQTDLEDLITLLSTHASKSTEFWDKLVEKFNNASLATHDHAQMTADAGTSTFKNLENLIVENSPWAAVCFEPVQGEVSKANEALMTHFSKCLQESGLVAKAFLFEADSYKESASGLAKKLNELWINCKHDAECEKVVLKTGEQVVGLFSNEFNDFAGRIEAYLEKDFAELQPCLVDYIDNAYFEDINKIYSQIVTCMWENDPETK